MKERIIAATGIYRECRCKRTDGRTRRYQMRRLIVAPMAVGCTLVPVTCYLVPHDAGRAEGSNGISPTVARATRPQVVL